jgi:CelD/BcsL family acetyltransferase involved in cellulose biosynthesis
LSSSVLFAENIGSPGHAAVDWDGLLRSGWGGIACSDATYSSAWISALRESLLKGQPVSAVMLRRSEATVGVLPYLRAGTGGRKLRMITEEYAGRASFLAGDGREAACRNLLEAFLSGTQFWDVLQLTVVEDSGAHRAIHAAAAQGRVSAACIGTVESPYIMLGQTWESTFQSLPKKLRWTIRKSEGDLTSLGNLVYTEHTEPAHVPEFLEALYQIEAGSWKQQSGTSITAQARQLDFYNSLAPHASKAGIFSGHLLRLDGKPLAYIMGLAAGDGTFLDLKESFVESHSQYSPAHVLKRFAMSRLIEKAVRIYDFMGVCEPYKMRWTDRIYRRHTLVLYNSTMRGRLLRLKSTLLRKGSPVPPPGTTAPA